MTNNFSQKEMLVRMMNKLDTIEDKLNTTHEKVVATNGKVQLHTKLITGALGGIVAMAGWILSIVFK